MTVQHFIAQSLITLPLPQYDLNNVERDVKHLKIFLLNNLFTDKID